MSEQRLSSWERHRFSDIKRDAEKGFYPTCQDMDLMIRIVDKLLVAPERVSQSGKAITRETFPRQSQEAMLF